MKILETFIEGKTGDPSRCEDALVVLDEGVAVIDGVTSKAAYKPGEKTSGRFATEVLAAALPAYIAEPDPFTMLCYLNEQLSQTEWFQRVQAQKASLTHSTSAEQPLPTNRLVEKCSVPNEREASHSVTFIEDIPRASIVIYQPQYQRVISYGDCQCSIAGRVYSHAKEIDMINAKKRQEVLVQALKDGKTVEELLIDDVGREAIQEKLIAQSQYENKKDEELGFSVLNGKPLAQSMMKVYPVSKGEEVILASDGYPYVLENLQASEAALQEKLARDPLFIEDPYISTKGLRPGNISFDDRAYVKLIVSF